MQLDTRDLDFIQNYCNRTLSFEEFQKMAKNESLSLNEKIGVPNSYRDKTESFILEDITSKVKSLNSTNKSILDIGSGCSLLTQLLIEKIKQKNNELVLCDSEEMLALVPNDKSINKISGKFPYNLDKFSNYKNKFDGIIVYSVLAHVILEDSIFNFIDSSLELLKSGGELLIGDLPNISKRERFFRSEKGIKCHQEYTQSNSMPELHTGTLQKNKIDDSIIFGILQRYRNFGYETYLLPQDSRLTMSSRSDDILIVKN
jgi:2-polyprenyl-3-methyl-5-hydroxy-6-metoxy-1,4-benzoquinol methylase